MGGTSAPERPQPLRQYTLIADGERGGLIGPRGDIAFLCAPRWHDDAVFSSLLGGRSLYAVTPTDPHYVWGGSYEQDTLIWRSRWVLGSSVVECAEALAFPGDPDRVVLLRRIEAVTGPAEVDVTLDCRAGFDTQPADLRRSSEGVWAGKAGALHIRWSGAPAGVRPSEHGLVINALRLDPGRSHDLVLELSTQPLPADPPDADRAWRHTRDAWQSVGPPSEASLAPRDVAHSWAVLRGLTSTSGAMVAAATTSLPERADQGRDYDYRYAWIRDQCFAGQAAAAAGGGEILHAAVNFVGSRLLEDGPRLSPAYTVDGDAVPSQRHLDLPGYPGAPDPRAGNHVRDQFQLDALGETLLLFASADRLDVLGSAGWRAAEVAADAIATRWTESDAGVWELEDRRWAHSRLSCAAGLRAVAARRPDRAAEWERLARHLVEDADRDCRHPSGRWQRSPDDPSVDAALLLPAIRGAVSADDPRSVATWRAVREELAVDGYVYRFRQQPGPLHEAEGAFVLCGFLMALATHQQGDQVRAVRWFERNRGALGPPGLFTEEYDVVQRQLRGNLPQAFVHALLIETAHQLADDGTDGPGTGF